MKDSLPFTSNELIHLNIEKLNERKGKVFKGENLNPYFRIGDNPEQIEIQEKVDELKKLLK